MSKWAGQIQESIADERIELEKEKADIRCWASFLAGLPWRGYNPMLGGTTQKIEIC